MASVSKGWNGVLAVRRAFAIAVVALLVLGAFVIVLTHGVAAEGRETGVFPDRTFEITRSPPGGPKSDVFISQIDPAASGYWSVRLDSLSGSAMIVQVYHLDGGVLTLVGSAKLRAVGTSMVAISLIGGQHYQIQFTPYGKSGLSVLTEHFLENVPPVACFTMTPESPILGEAVTFDASCSSDSDGTINAYSWDFGDGETGSGASVTHTYASEGSYAVALTAYDDLSGWGCLTKNILVSAPANQAPVAEFNFAPANPIVQDLVAFDSSASYDPDGSLVAYAWDFGDGFTADVADPAHAYAADGIYAVSLTVTDDDGATDTATKTVVVAPNQPPVAEFSWSPASPKAVFDTVHFTAAASQDPDGSIVSYAWDFADGNSGTGVAADHVYASAGDYGVLLTVTDNKGATASQSQTVHVLQNLAPTADFTWAPPAPKEGALVTFDASSSIDADGTIASYAWAFGDGGSGTGKIASHAFAAGTWTVQLVVVDDNGATDTATADVVVAPNLAPVACFSFVAEGILAGQPVHFDAACSADPDGSIALYAWDFGDGATGTGNAADHTYDAAGTYIVALVVTDDGGLTDTASDSLVVHPQPIPPTASFVFAPASPLAGDTVSFDASASADADGWIVNYAWDFGDGGTASGVTATHAYAAAGLYPVLLTVTDNDGLPGTATKAVNVGAQPIPPVADFVFSPAAPVAGDAVHFDASTSTDADGTIVSYSWNFGDGANGAGVTADHAYVSANTYTVTLTVEDSDGLTDSLSKPVDVSPAPIPPSAAFGFTPASPVAGEVVHFDATASSDPDGSIASYAWDFGDGGTGSGVQTDHSFAAGTFAVQLTVTDTDGLTDSVSHSVVVSPVPLPPIAAFGFDPAAPLVGDAVHFDASSSSDPDGWIASYAWDFGDGAIGSGVGFDHAFSAVGDFTVTLTVTDNDGMTDTVSHVVSVSPQPIPPTASFVASPAKPLVDATVSFDASGSTDPDDAIVSYAWDFGDGHSGSGKTATHAYTSHGTFTVTLTVTDASALWDATSSAVTVYAAPVAAFMFSPTAPLAGDTVSFDASASTDADGLISSYEWAFGDGATGSGVTATHAFAAVGLYPVVLTVTDSDAFTGTLTKVVNVGAQPVPPTASFVFSPAKPLVGAMVSFDASGSTDPDDAIVSYAWTFGDGNTGTGVAPTHSYATFGTFTVTLTVTDASTLTDSSSRPVHVYSEPSAAFFASPAKPLVSTPVAFDASASQDPDGSLVAYAWAFGDGNTGTGQTPSHTYAAFGTFTVTLTVTDADGFTASVSHAVKVYASPSAAFVWSPAKPLVAALVSFDASGSSDPDGTLASYAWDFGDLAIGIGKTATHSYGSFGSYVVTLTVTDADGFTASVSHTVKIYAQPVAAFGSSPARPLVGELVTLDASSSSDPDGTLSSYAWNLGDGNTATGQVATHAYLAFGVYSVTLTVTDADGFTAAVTHDVKVYAAPNADFSYNPASPQVYQPIFFDAGLSSDPDGSIAVYNWEFGDGTYLTGITATHAFETGGLKTVTLAVTDTDGFMDTATKMFTVLVPPVAQFTWSPSLPLVGQLVGFDATGSWDPDGSIVSYAWDFGDLSGATGVSPSHAFATFGTFSVVLTVTDNSGLTNQVTKTVRIAVPPVAAFSWSPAKPLVGDTVTFDGSGSSDADGPIASYSWEFADGFYAAGASATHAYAAFGTYSVILVVTDADGLTTSITHSVRIYALPSASFTSSPAKPLQGTPVSFDASASADPDGTLASYAWDFGEMSTGVGKTVSHTYTAWGTYPVKLTVTDADGFSASVTVNVKIYVGPTALFGSSPAMPSVGDTVTFFASASTDPDGTVVAYAWEFGDGNLGSGVTATHAYGSWGTFTVRLTVTDADGFTGTYQSGLKVYAKPVASFVTSPAKPLVGALVSFDASASSDPDGAALTFGWTFGDGNSGTGMTATHAYAAFGTYSIVLTVTDADGFSATASGSVKVYANPIADFSWAPLSPKVGDTVSFTATASDPDGTIASYAWTFGDGGSANVAGPTHAYSTYGPKTVTLTVTDADGFTAAKTHTVTVLAPPVAAFTWAPSLPLIDEAVAFNAAGSSDADGSIATLAWTFGDAGTATGINPTHSYATYGTFTVTLTVTDNDGLTAQVSHDVRVAAKPVASFTSSPAKPVVDATVSFDASASGDADGSIVAYAWTFGDTGTGSGITATHAYPIFGSFSVTLTVTDSDGLTGSTTKSVQVYAVPVAAFTFSPAAPKVGDTVSFDATSSSDADGTIVSYAWAFGDVNSGSGATATHAYASAATFSVTLTVTDGDGFTGQITKDVVVAPAGPSGPGADWTFYDFFNVPYGEWWDIRNYQGTFGGFPEPPIGADCFTEAGIADWWCSGTSLAGYPYMNWMRTPVGDFVIATSYRFTADIRQNPAMTMEAPLMLPRCADLQAAAAAQGVTIVCPTTMPSGGSFSIDERINYIDNARATELSNAGCPDLTWANDGYLTELTATITMDSAAAARLFGITDTTALDFGTTSTSLLKAGCGTGIAPTDAPSGVLEMGLKAWFEAQGNGAYDVLSINNIPFALRSIDASGTYDAGTGKYTLVLDLAGSGFEQLFARWAYWGSAGYISGLAGATPTGWWGMEVPFLEDLVFKADVGATAFDAQVSGVIEDHFRASATAGPDGLWRTADDVPMWVWQPVLGDRYPAVPGHLSSELKPYQDALAKYVHSTPGSSKYGTSTDYDYVPAVWALKADETQKFEFPTTPVVLFDPYASPRSDSPSTLVTISGTLTLGTTSPASGVGTYDAGTNTISVVGPVAVGTYPTTTSGKPLESRVIYRLVKA